MSDSPAPATTATPGAGARMTERLDLGEVLLRTSRLEPAQLEAAQPGLREVAAAGPLDRLDQAPRHGE